MDPEAARRALDAERAETVALVELMARRLESVVDAGADAAADDEHDPEGSTLAFERGQLIAQLDRSRVRLAETDAAIDRITQGTYGICESCGGPIAPVRLEALPAARLCIACAASTRRSGRW